MSAQEQKRPTGPSLPSWVPRQPHTWLSHHPYVASPLPPVPPLSSLLLCYSPTFPLASRTSPPWMPPSLGPLPPKYVWPPCISGLGSHPAPLSAPAHTPAGASRGPRLSPGVWTTSAQASCTQVHGDSPVTLKAPESDADGRSSLGLEEALFFQIQPGPADYTQEMYSDSCGHRCPQEAQVYVLPWWLLPFCA